MAPASNDDVLAHSARASATAASTEAAAAGDTPELSHAAGAAESSQQQRSTPARPPLAPFSRAPRAIGAGAAAPDADPLERAFGASASAAAAAAGADDSSPIMASLSMPLVRWGLLRWRGGECVCACVCVCMRARVHACVRACVRDVCAGVRARTRLRLSNPCGARARFLNCG
jgi:hypothetical protein